MRWVLAVLLLTGCAAWFEPSTDQPYAPPAVYADWWAQTEACSGRHGELGLVRFYVLEPGNGHAGWTYGHDIFIKQEWVTSRAIVRHEMLHVLLGGDGDHENTAWTACGLYPMTWALAEAP